MSEITLELTPELAYYFACSFAGMCRCGADADIAALQGNIFRLTKIFTKEQKEEFREFEKWLKTIPIDQLLRVEQDMLKHPIEMVKHHTT